MVRPISLRGSTEGVELKQPRPAVSVFRAATCYVRAGLNVLGGATRTPEGAARELGYRDPLVDTLIQRAATSAADTISTGWAHELAGVAIFDLVQSITSLSAAAEVIGRGLKISMDRYAEYRIPGRVLNAAAAGLWTAEETAASVRQLSVSNTAILRPRKLSVLVPYTRELAESSNIEAVVRQTVGEAAGLALDGAMFSANAGSAGQPPGLLNGIAPLTPTAADPGAMTGDLKQLFAALAAVGAGKTAVIVAAMPQAVTLKTTVGPKFDYDIIASTSLPAGTVAVVEVASLVSGFSSVPEFRTSKTAIYHSEDTSPTDITSGTPSPAVPVRSAYQTDSILLRMDVMAAWGLRAAGHAQWIQGALW
jgi:hypothetical protein